MQVYGSVSTVSGCDDTDDVRYSMNHSREEHVSENLKPSERRKGLSPLRIAFYVIGISVVVMGGLYLLIWSVCKNSF
jgi:hypothetical protein